MVLVGRYNHSRYGVDPSLQLTSHPRLPNASFHDWMNYAILKRVE